MILQGIFAPTDTIEDVTNFLKEHLAHPEKPFHICESNEFINFSITAFLLKTVGCYRYL